MKSAALLALTASIGLATAAAGLPAAKAVNYSDDPTKPTSIKRDSQGRYVFEGRVAGVSGAACAANPVPTNCADFVKIAVPKLLQVTKINLDYYNAVDDRAFVSLQAGSTYTAFSGAGALAYNHFGWRGLCATNYGPLRPATPSANYNCTNGTDTNPVSTPATTDLFKNVYTANPPSPVIGAPLTEGDYTFWIQQITGDSEYRFTVTTAYVPGPLPVLGAAGAFGWARSLRRRLRAG
ncbi:MAG: hypothetical protein ACKOPN_03500 [Prochlorococcaceae cyanobacterium]